MKSQIQYAEIPPWKEGEDLDLVIAHWVQYAPGYSGMYETVKELCIAENEIPGVLAGLVEPIDKPDCRAGGKRDPAEDILTQPWSWALQDATLHMIHYSTTPFSRNLSPCVFMIHGGFLPVLYAELTEKTHAGRALSSAINWINKCEASICIHKQQYYYYKHFDFNDKLHFVTRGVNLKRWKPRGSKMRLDGKPAVTYGEVWRLMKDPAMVMFAVLEYAKQNPNVRLNVFGASTYIPTWENLIYGSKIHQIIGRWGLCTNKSFPEHWYRAADMLLYPALTGEHSRVGIQAMACGCPVIAWDTDAFDDWKPNRRARPFDPRDMAEQISSLWEEIKNNRDAVRKNCTRYARSHFDVREMAKTVVSICRKVQEEVK